VRTPHFYRHSAGLSSFTRCLRSRIALFAPFGRVGQAMIPTGYGSLIERLPAPTRSLRRRTPSPAKPESDESLAVPAFLELCNQRLEQILYLRALRRKARDTDCAVA